MEKVVAYRSFDGKFFLNREECRRYEVEKDIVCFRINGEKTEDIEEAVFVYLKSDEASENFNEEYGYNTIGMGLYMWSSWREDYLYWGEIVDLYENGTNSVIDIEAKLKEGDEY